MIGLIESMWRKLTLHASSRSEHFPEYFAHRTFDQRREELLSKSRNGQLHIDVARDARTGQDLGYCVSSIDGKGEGEIESLFVDEISRGRGWVTFWSAGPSARWRKRERGASPSSPYMAARTCCRSMPVTASIPRCSCSSSRSKRRDGRSKLHILLPATSRRGWK